MSLTATARTFDRGHMPMPANSPWGPILGYGEGQLTAAVPDTSYQRELIGPQVAMMGQALKQLQGGGNREGYFRDVVSPSMESFQTGVVMLTMETLMRTVGDMATNENNILLRIFSPIPMNWEIDRISMFYNIMTISAPRQIGPNMHGYTPSWGNAGKSVATTSFAKSLHFENNVLLTARGRAQMSDGLQKLAASFTLDVYQNAALTLKNSPDPPLSAYFRDRQTVENLMLGLTRSFAAYNHVEHNFQERLIELAADKMSRVQGQPPTIMLGSPIHGFQRNLSNPATNYEESGPAGQVMKARGMSNDTGRLTFQSLALFSDVDRKRNVLTETRPCYDYVFQKKHFGHISAIGMYIPDADDFEHFTLPEIAGALFRLFGHEHATDTTGYHSDRKGFYLGPDPKASLKPLMTRPGKDPLARLLGLFTKKAGGGVPDAVKTVERIIDLSEAHLPTTDVLKAIRRVGHHRGEKSIVSAAASKVIEAVKIDVAKVTAFVHRLLGAVGSSSGATPGTAADAGEKLSAALNHTAAILGGTHTSAGADAISAAFADYLWYTDVAACVPWTYLAGTSADVTAAAAHVFEAAWDTFAVATGLSITDDMVVAHVKAAALAAVATAPTGPTAFTTLVAAIATLGDPTAPTVTNGYVVSRLAEDVKRSGLNRAAFVTHAKSAIPAYYKAALALLVGGADKKNLAAAFGEGLGLWHLEPLAGSPVTPAQIEAAFRSAFPAATADSRTYFDGLVEARYKKLKTLAPLGGELLVLLHYFGTDISEDGFENLYLLGLPWPYRVGLMQMNNYATGDMCIITSEDVGKLGITGLDIQQGEHTAAWQKLHKMQMKMGCLIHKETSVVKCPMAAVTAYDRPAKRTFFSPLDQKCKFSPFDFQACDGFILPFLLGWKEADPNGWMTPMGNFWCFPALTAETEIEENKVDAYAFSSIIMLSHLQEFNKIRGVMTGTSKGNTGLEDGSYLGRETGMPFLCREATVELILHDDKMVREEKSGWWRGDFGAGSMPYRTCNKSLARHTNDMRLVKKLA